MDTRSVPAPPTTRELRGLALYRDHGDEIERVLPHVYVVPGCSGGEYVVHLGRQTCTCPDFERHHAPCKHLYAAEIAASKTRIRTRRSA